MAGKHKLDGKEAAPFQIGFLDVITAFLKWCLMERQVDLPTYFIPARGAGETRAWGSLRSPLKKLKNPLGLRTIPRSAASAEQLGGGEGRAGELNMELNTQVSSAARAKPTH